MKNDNCLDNEISVWDDAYENGHQFISDKDKNVLYERWKRNNIKEIDDIKVDISLVYWSPWQKVAKPYRMNKAWKVKALTTEDLILGNFTKEAK